MLDELVSMLSQTDLEDYGSLILINARLSDRNELKLILKVQLDDEPDFPADWEITCHEVKDHRLTLGSPQFFGFEDDHVLSWAFVKPHCRISFRGAAENPLTVVGALRIAHRELAGKWIPFDRYFNRMIALEDLISGGFGELASGAPVEFANAYEKVMRDCGFSVSRSRPELRSSAGDIPHPTMTFDDSYVVAEMFEARTI